MTYGRNLTDSVPPRTLKKEMNQTKKESGMKDIVRKIRISYLDIGCTKRNGNDCIFRKDLKDVLESMSVADKKVCKKDMTPVIYPYLVQKSVCVYDDSVVNRINLKGECLFFDIDDESLFSEMWEHQTDLKRLMPSLAAMWFSMHDKGHIVFRCDWKGNSGYHAHWYAMSSILYDTLLSVLGKRWAVLFSTKKVNDHGMSNALQNFSVGYTKDYTYWDTFEVFSPCDIDASVFSHTDIEKAKPGKYTLFTDSDVMNKWIGCDMVDNFTKWCEKHRGYVHSVENKTLPYDKTMCVYGEVVEYWINDGSYYHLNIGYYSPDYVLHDGKKRSIRTAAIFYACVMGMPFEECLYNVGKYYCMFMGRFGFDKDLKEERYAKNVILNETVDVFANKKLQRTSFLRDNRPVIVGPHRFLDKEWVYYDTPHNIMSNMERRKIAAKVKSELRRECFSTLYKDGDTIKTMTEKMLEFYPKITESVVKKIAKECGIIVRKKRRDSKEYVNVYDLDGKRTKVRAELVDGKKYFASKKEWKNHKSK